MKSAWKAMTEYLSKMVNPYVNTCHEHNESVGKLLASSYTSLRLRVHLRHAGAKGVNEHGRKSCAGVLQRPKKTGLVFLCASVVSFSLSKYCFIILFCAQMWRLFMLKYHKRKERKHRDLWAQQGCFLQGVILPEDGNCRSDTKQNVNEAVCVSHTLLLIRSGGFTYNGSSKWQEAYDSSNMAITRFHFLQAISFPFK